MQQENTKQHRSGASIDRCEQELPMGTILLLISLFASYVIFSGQMAAVVVAREKYGRSTWPDMTPQLGLLAIRFWYVPVAIILLLWVSYVLGCRATMQQKQRRRLFVMAIVVQMSLLLSVAFLLLYPFSLTLFSLHREQRFSLPIFMGSGGIALLFLMIPCLWLCLWLFREYKRSVGRTEAAEEANSKGQGVDETKATTDSHPD